MTLGAKRPRVTIMSRNRYQRRRIACPTQATCRDPKGPSSQIQEGLGSRHRPGQLVPVRGHPRASAVLRRDARAKHSVAMPFAAPETGFRLFRRLGPTSVGSSNCTPHHAPDWTIDAMSDWIEVWIDQTLDPPYILVVRGSMAAIEAFDPHEANRVVFRSANYDDVRLWLLEDEYEMVRGRTPVG